jgi:putative ATP-binding cassette transporter
VSRLEDFQSKVAAVNKASHESVHEEKACTHDAICVRNAELRTPGSGQILVSDLSMSIGKGERLLVVGPSGCGKTSVLRMISGLWKPETGSVETPHRGELLFIPQRPYMLLGTLREQLCYPLEQDSFSDEQLRYVLQQVSLNTLSDRYPDLSVKQDWPRLLSLGEQQRLAFARLLLNSPEYVVLDEATSALDVATERQLYERMLQRGTSCISVGHRPSLVKFHDQVLELQGEGGNWRMLPAATYSFHGVRDSPTQQGCQLAL